MTMENSQNLSRLRLRNQITTIEKLNERIKSEIFLAAANIINEPNGSQKNRTVENLLHSVNHILKNENLGLKRAEKIRAVFDALTDEDRLINKINWFIDESKGEKLFDPSDLNKWEEEVRQRRKKEETNIPKSE